MYRPIAFCRKPADPAACEGHYSKVHAPPVCGIPGPVRVVINRPQPAPWGGEPGVQLIAKMHVPDRPTFEAAMRSVGNRAAGQDLRPFAKYLVTLVTVSDA